VEDFLYSTNKKRALSKDKEVKNVKNTETSLKKK